MNCRQRYALATITILSILALIFWSFPQSAGRPGFGRRAAHDDRYPAYDEQAASYVTDENDFVAAISAGTERRRTSDCRMSNCFDFSRCVVGEFRVYVYPPIGLVSVNYGQILRALKASRYYTSDPKQACVFILAIDTLDRDKLSAEYVPNIQVCCIPLSLRIISLESLSKWPLLYLFSIPVLRKLKIKF